MKTRQPNLSREQILARVTAELRSARASGDPVPLGAIVAFSRLMDWNATGSEEMHELQEWLWNANVTCGPGGMTPREITHWLANRAGADHRRRVPLLNVFKWIRRAFPGES